jgi:MFS family permease
MIFRALRYRNYRLYFFGQGISLIGTWLTRVATGWLVYRLTDSAFLLGVVGFSGQIPIFLLSPLSGVLADRWNRHRLLVTSQSLSMLQSLMLAVLVLSSVIQVWQIILLSIFQGLINAFDIPTRQAFVVQMVEKREDVANAIALNSSMFNSARLIGPSIAGVLIASVGEGICFLIDGISYIAVIISLLLMRIPEQVLEDRVKKIFGGLKEGFRYAFGFPPIRSILLLLGLVSVLGFPYTVLLPVFARDILKGGANTLGFLTGATGVGALTGAIYLASRKSVVGLGRIITMAGTLFALSLIVFSLSRTIWLSLILMYLTGFSMMVQMASANTILQTIVDDDKRGRVMSFYSMAFIGMAPFGSLLAGAVASEIGAPYTVMIGGMLCLIGPAVFAGRLPTLRAMVRPIYVKKGIIPEVTSGIQTATQLSELPKK